MKIVYLAIKWVAIALAVAAFLYLAAMLAQKGYTIPMVVAGLLGVCVLAIYGTRRAVPMKYLFPGMLAMIALQIWPILFTAGIAFTNYGDGHLFSKDEAVKNIVAGSVQEVPNTPRYQMSVAVPEGQSKTTADLTLVLVDPKGTVFTGTPQGLKEIPKSDVTQGVTGKVSAAKGYELLNAREINARSKDLQQLAVPTTDGGGIKPVGLSEAFEGKATVSYDQAKDQLYDSTTKKTYVVKDGKFVADDGSGDSFSQGWLEGVGFNNFSRMLTDPTLRSGFIGVFIWNLVFAAVTVIGTFVVGMLIALLFNDPRLKGKGIYRSLLILPYALPVFVTGLVWRGMYNQDYGLINNLFHLNIDWLGDSTWAKVALLIANIWLGFPYMFLVCTGALQSIPGDVREAAKIDGANAVQTLQKIVMPLLLVAVGPLLIASFAFNFNNFSLVYLLTKGGPFEGASEIGGTDLLITYAYRLAFSGSAPSFGFASAVSVFIFALTALMIIPSFRATRALEEVN